MLPRSGWILKARGQFLTSPLAPRGNICSLGGMFTASFTPRGEQSLLFTRMEFTPQGITSPQGGLNSLLVDNFAPGGQLRPWGSKFSPRGEVKNGPLV
jgi:hypothetical protein